MKHLKKKWMSMENWREKRRNKDSGAVASPASLEALPIDSSGKSSTSDLTEPRTPNCPIRTAPEASMSDEPSKLVVASATEPISNTSSDLTVTTDPGAEEGQPVRNSQDQQNPEYPISQRLWNKAYDSLEQDEDTADLVRSYAKILEKILHANRASDSSASEDDVSVERKAAADRQRYMRDLVAEGRKKFATTSKITGGLSNVVEYIQKAKGVVDLAVANIPQAALPWAGVCIGLQILSNPGKATKSNLEGIVYVISRMDWYCALSEHLLNEEELIESFESILKELEKAIITLYKTLLLYQIKSACYYHQHRGLAILRGLASWDDWDSDLQSVKKAEDDVRKMSSQYQKEYEKDRLRQLYNSGVHMEESLGNIHQDLQAVIDQQKSMWTDGKNKKCLQDLFVVDPRNNMRTIMQNKEELLADVYEWMFSSDEYTAFIDWDNEASHSSQCRLLWVTGSAGTGKTMLLMGIIDELQRQFSSLAPRLSYFFCQATKINLNNATNALRSLIWMLLFQQPHLIKHIQPDYDHMGRALFENEDAFNALDSIFESMLEDPSLSPVYFIIDALDECEKGLNLLLRLISKSFTLSDRVKWLVSSRPEVLTQHDIQDELQHLESPHVSRILVELDHKRLKDPVNVYIEHKLSALKGRTGYSDEVLTNISAEVRQRANNIFLWVALVFKELSNVRGWDAVETIQHMPSGLPGLYDRIMVKIGGLRGMRHCKNVLVAVSLAFRPLSFSELAVAADLPAGDDVPRIVVKECGSFLTVTAETVSLIHQSAKDYLDENHKSKLWPGGVTQGHMDICERSIDAMSALRENIYGIKEQDADPKDVEIPNPDPLARMRYSCLFWVDHLSLSPHDAGHHDRIHSFLKKHFLHWLEALSLLGSPYECFRMINKLEIVSPSESELYSLVRDAKRFILKNAFVIEFAPIQLYSSAILFSPQASTIRDLFQHNIRGMKILSGLDRNWGPNLQIFDRGFEKVMFSPDGKRLVLSSTDRHIQVRNAMTGQVKHTLEGHSRYIKALSISPDGSLLASGSTDTTIRIWNMTTGRTESVLTGYESAVHAVAFSPCGNFLASGSEEDTKNLRLWDVASGQIKHIFEVPSSVGIVLFSPSGKKLAAGSYDNTTWMCDVLSGQTEHTLNGFCYFNEPCLAASPDWSKLASRADERTIQVWDVTKWQPKRFGGHQSDVTAIVFSPGNKLLSGSMDGKIRVWDVATGQIEHTLEIQSLRFGMALSPEGSRLASFSKRIVQLWSTKTWRIEGKLEGHESEVTSVAFSPNMQILASVSALGSVRLSEIPTGPAEYAFEGHSDRVTILALSPDGTKLASGSNDTTVRIWDVTTGKTERVLRHSNQVTAVAFSPDGSALVSASGSAGIIHTWDTTTGGIKDTLRDPNPRREGYGRVDSILYSLDGRKVAFVLSYDPSIRLWDVATGQVMVLPHNNMRRRGLAFSPDGTRLASVINNHVVSLLNTTTGESEGFLKGHQGLIKALAFSPDGRKLASSSSDKTIRIWDVVTCQMERTLCCDNSCWTLLFSPDGRKVASGSDDDTIRVWDTTTGRADRMFRADPVSIATTVFDLDSTPTGQIIDRVGSLPFYSMDETRRWVTRNSTKFLYLPPEFQPGRLVTSGRTLVTTNASRVTILEFDEDSKGSLVEGSD